MADLVVRRLLVDMEAPIARHWCSGDAFRTAFLNALSMSFPVGEQFFIDSVRKGHKALPEHLQRDFDEAVRSFVGQEATHRRLHSLYNQHLERLGLENQWGPRAKERLVYFDNAPVLESLAAVATFEHFTSIIADWALRHPDMLKSDDKRLTTLWLWHSAEESEHRSVAFDLFKAAGGSEKMRIYWFRLISKGFVLDIVRQTILNLRRDGTLWRWRTWVGAKVFLFGKRGLVRTTYRPWRDYYRAGFHPNDHDDSASRAWLEANSSQYVPVGG